jgi:hypothetical protein
VAALLLLLLLLLLRQDMPGWGCDVDPVSNLKTVAAFLLEQRKRDLLDNMAGVTSEGSVNSS